jgi:aspartate aminotransferase
MILSKRIANLSPSKTVLLDSKVKQYIQEGMDIVNLGVGEPSEPTEDVIKQAGIQTILQNQTRYSSPTGLQPLKEAICQKLTRQNGFSGKLKYAAEQIVVSAGAKQAVFNALMATIDPGDEVLIPAPYWVTYPELVKLLGGIPVVVPTTKDREYKVSPELLEKYVTPKSKLLILNTPSNPTGMVYTRQELEEIGDWIVQQDLYCLSDEIYEYITYEGAKHTSPAAVSEDMYERTILVNGMSKAYSMTGWRLGYSAAPLTLSKAMGALQSQTTHHPSNISQYAGLEALKHEPSTVIAPMLQALHSKRKMTLDALNVMQNELGGIEYLTTQGAFYVWIEVHDFLMSCKNRHPSSSIENEEQLAEYLLDIHRVALVPGSAFGQPGALRLSFTPSLDTLQKGLERIHNGLSELHGKSL